MTWTKKFIPFALFFMVALSQCRGGPKCGPLSDPSTDADADCIANSADNCPFDYNPNQADVDDDGVGSACDLNDSDSSVGSSSDSNLRRPLLKQNETKPDSSDLQDVLNVSHDCSVYLMGCDNRFLGYLSSDEKHPLSVGNPFSDYGSLTSENSIFNSLGMYGRSFTTCSAFNTDADLAPELYCFYESTGNHEYIGVMHFSPQSDDEFDSCLIVKALGRNHKDCDSH